MKQLFSLEPKFYFRPIQIDPIVSPPVCARRRTLQQKEFVPLRKNVSTLVVYVFYCKNKFPFNVHVTAAGEVEGVTEVAMLLLGDLILVIIQQGMVMVQFEIRLESKLMGR